MRTLLLASTILLLTSFFTNAQQPIPKIVTAQEFIGQDGALNAYDIETDSRGYLYIASDRGLASFNGFELRRDNIYYKKGIYPYYSGIHKDYDGDLWFSSNKGISYLENDSLLAYPVPDSVLRLGPAKFETVYQDKSGLLHISPRWNGHFTVDIHGNVKGIDTRKNTDIYGFIVTQLEDGSWFHYSIASEEREGALISVYYLNNKNELKKIAETDERDVDYHSSLVKHADNSLSLSLGSKTLIRFKGDKLISLKKFDFDLINLFVDSRNDLWIGTLGHGAIQAKNSNLADLTNYYDGNFAVVTETDDGGLWFKSNKMGFGYFPPNSVNHYSEQNGYEEISDVAVVNVVNEKICFSTRKGKVYFVNANNLEQLEPPINDYRAHAKEVCFDKKNGTYWYAFNQVIYGIREDKVITIKLDSTRFTNKKISCLKNIGGRIFGITNLNFFEIKNNKIVNVSEKSTIGIFQDFTQDDQGTFWFATNKGIGILKGKSLARLPYEMPENLNGHASLIFFAHGSVWALFLDNTLIKMNLKTHSIVVDQKNDPVELRSYTIGNKGEIWGINADVKLIRINKTKDWNIVRTEIFEIPKHYVDVATKYQMAFLNETIYLGGKYGLFELKLKDLKPESNSTKLIFQILINLNVSDFDSGNYLLKITFDGVEENHKLVIE